MKNIGVFICNGSEDIETVTPIDIWRRAGQNIKTISIESSEIVK